MVKGKVALITGSSTGIGAATALKFAKDGASGIVITGRQEEKLKMVKQECEKIGGKNVKVHMVVGDITNEKTRKKLVDETVKVFGRLDILINNAGAALLTPICEASLDLLDKTFDLNVRSVVELTQLAIPHLIKSGGNIVNISSVASTKATTPLFCFYGMSKAALDMFTKHLTVELGPKGVRVNSINPGPVPGTEFLRNMNSSGSSNAVSSSEEAIARARSKMPLRRVGQAEEVADAIAYIASDKASFVTGSILPVDGGYALG